MKKPLDKFLEEYGADHPEDIQVWTDTFYSVMKALSEPTEAMIKAGDDAMAENIQRSWRGEYDKPGVVWIFQEMLAAAILEGRNSLGHSDQPQTEGAKNE